MSLFTAETVVTEDGFAALAPEWDDLVRAMPRPSPFLLHGWLTEWWRHYGAGELAVPVVRHDGRLAGALPIAVRRRMGARVAVLMGDRQCVLGDALLADDADEAVLTALALRLRETGCDLLDLHGLPDGSRLARALGPDLDVVQRVEAPVLDLDDGWDAVYHAKTSGKKRNLHRRRRRQLSELGETTTTVARTIDELEPALEEAFALHALRWEGRPDGSGFATSTGMRFHRAVLRRLAAIDVPRIVTLRLDGRAVAFHYFWLLEDHMYVHRLAFDPALARCSPGLVNTLDAIEAAAAEGATRVEFLGGDERYKLELADRFEPLCHGVGLATGIRARALAAGQLGTIDLRKRLKRRPRLHRLYMDGAAPLRRVMRRVRTHLTA